MSDAVIRLRKVQSGVDRYRKPIYIEASFDLPPGLLDPGGSTEPVEVGRTPVVTSPSCYWRNLWPDVVKSDRLIVRNRTFEVIGVPADWQSAHGGAIGGLVVELKEAT